MEEEFKQGEVQPNNREEQYPVTPAYGADPSVAPMYNSVPFFTPYPMYVMPDYRSYYPAYNYYPQDFSRDAYPHYQFQPEEQDHTDQRNMHDLCRRYHYHLVQFEGTDGNIYDGIIESVDNDNVYMLEPVGDKERDFQEEMNRQYYGYGGFPHFGYGFPRRFRRFRRRRFPFFFLRRLFFPFFY